MTFEWDENKNNTNIRKHGIAFEEAMTVFKDEQAVLVFDEERSTDEDRFNIIGFSQLTRLLIICHCYREQDTTIRIISARKATATETEDYRRLGQ